MARGLRSVDRKELILIILLLSCFFIQSLVTSIEKDMIFDDPMYITGGIYFVKYLDTSMFIVHPPLQNILAGILPSRLNLNLPYSYSGCSELGDYVCSQKILFESGNDANKISFYASIPFILISLFLGFLVFSFAKDLYGTKSAIFALTLYSFSTVILAYNNFILTDVLLATFIFSSIYLLWKIIKSGVTNTRIILLGLSVGLAISSKITGLLIIPIIVLFYSLAFYRYNFLGKKEPLSKHITRFFVVIGIAFLVLWSLHFFSFDTVSNSIPKRNVERLNSEIESIFPKDSLQYTLAMKLAHDVKIPAPQYLVGIAAQTKISDLKAKQGYLNGETYEGGRWYYFFEVILIKTQIPLLIFFIISIIYTTKLRKKGIYNELFLIIPIILFFGLMATSNFNLGLRHIVPIFPFIFVLSSRIIKIRSNDKKINKIFRICLWALLIWYIASALLIMPNYMSYFNEFVGGPENGHYYLLSSNLDSGQDLNKLAKYLNENKLKDIKLSYHGTADPSYYGIKYEPLPMEHYVSWHPGFFDPIPPLGYTENCSKREGIIAISVSNFHGYNLLNNSCFDWLKDEEPIKKIGYTIFVYNITK